MSRIGYDGIRRELGPMWRLAGPVVAAEIGWILMGVVDTMMVGRIGANAIGAVSVGRALYMFPTIFGYGLLLGLDTLVSNAFGAGRIRETHETLIQGTYTAIGLSVPLTALVWATTLVLEPFGIAAEVRGPAIAYMQAVSWSVLPFLVFFCFRRYLQAINLVRPVMFGLISANLVNAAFNWVLIFGKLGFPALGAEGAGWATVASATYLTLFLLWAILLHDREERSGLLTVPRRLDFARIRRLFRIGLPAAVQVELEVGIFAGSSVLIALIDAVSLAAHQVTIVLVSVTAMVPLGVSSAAAVRVGQALGREDRPGAMRAGWTGIALGAAFMAVAAATFVVVPRGLIRLFTADGAVIALGVPLLYLGAAFQMFDGVQMVATGALRGAGQTRIPMIWNLVCYWIVGVPLGWALCFRYEWGAFGVWTGLTIALILVAALLTWTWRRQVLAWERCPPVETAS
ncbi:MAG: MATE family efflux transporter [bacterium]|nr:MATE family efflux transporter [bacterium]